MTQPIEVEFYPTFMVDLIKSGQLSTQHRPMEHHTGHAIPFPAEPRNPVKLSIN
ncbi:hypothetical protein CMEL01_04900 [Colletotrichum melonis]|uniref:Uncharacterized protein n=1 Tax=Colletotrichum melonis TaxID=1209925 RepID=A0AAI9XME0_9PEZI|nr:hypothetical protein CMEL01_04900 [Colletotrichum melonis]